MAAETNIVDVRTTQTHLVVSLDDGREVRTPLRWYPRLATASPRELRQWELLGGGEAVSWPSVDEDLSLAGMLAGVQAPEFRFKPPPPAENRANNAIAAAKDLYGAKDFYGASLAQVEARLTETRSRLQELLEQIPEPREDTLSMVRGLVNSFEPLIEAVEDAAYAHEVENHLDASPRREPYPAQTDQHTQIISHSDIEVEAVEEAHDRESTRA